MNKFSKPYDIDKVVIPVSNLKIVDPGTVLDADGNYFTLSSYSVKRLFSLLNMGSGQFSKKLHTLEPSVWMQFLQQRLGLTDIQEILSYNNAVVIDDTVVTIGEGDTHVEDVVASINDYINDESLNTSYLLYDKDMLVVIAVNSEGYGVLIKYYYQDNWVTIHDCYYKPSEAILLVSPYKELDTKVGEDISLLMEKNVIIANSTSTMPYQLEAYKKKLQETCMSVDELSSYLKKFFKIKLTMEPIDILDYAAEHDDMSSRVINQLEMIINKFYSNPEAVMSVYSPYLKRATSITSVTYGDFSRLLELLFLEEDDAVHVNDLTDFQSRVINQESHYAALKS